MGNGGIFGTMTDSILEGIHSAWQAMTWWEAAGVFFGLLYIFLVGRESNRYTIMSGNPLHKKKVDSLKQTLNRLNTLDKEGRKGLYKDIIKDATLSDKGGAGLGFVDMARKSGDKLAFDFPEMSDDYCLFCLAVNVSREPNSPN